MMEIHKTMFSLYDNDSRKRAHCLIEITKLQLKRLQANCIIIEDVTSMKECEYSNISYGKKLKCAKRHREMLSHKTCDLIKLSNVKHNYVIILCNKKTCLQMFPQLCIVSMGSLYDHGNKETVDSGYLILFVGCAKGRSKGWLELNWNVNDFKSLKRCKKKYY